ASIVVSIIKISSEKPAFGISYHSTNKLIVPAFYFAYDKSFTISCLFLNFNGDVIASCNEYITQPVKLPISHDSARTLLGTFLPKGNMSLNGTDYIQLLINITDPHTTGQWTMSMNLFDSSKFFHKIHGYDPWSEDFSGDTFAKTLDYMNLYYLSRKTYYSLTFSSKIRNKITQPALAYIGLESDYFPQYYIESQLQFTSLKDRPEYNLAVEINIAGFVIEEETEQRSNTVITTVGSLFGYYGMIAYFYKILFGSRLMDSAREYTFLLATFLYLAYSMFKRKIIGTSSSDKAVFFI
ncbi:3171_t:CDS:2, partial [Entrophospora sp. SA101]